MNEQPNNPLHGVKLADIVEQLQATLGWQAMAEAVPINCFKSNPTIKSSLKFLRRTDWARAKVEALYLDTFFPDSAPTASKPRVSTDSIWGNFNKD